MQMTNSNGWYPKLLGFGVPVSIANRMAYDLGALGYNPNNFANPNALVATLQQDGRVTQLDWWADLIAWVQQMLATLQQITPGIILTVAGGLILYFLRNVKYKNIPMGLFGLAPLGYGMWIMVQPFLPKAG